MAGVFLWSRTQDLIRPEWPQNWRALWADDFDVRGESANAPL